MCLVLKQETPQQLASKGTLVVAAGMARRLKGAAKAAEIIEGLRKKSFFEKKSLIEKFRAVCTYRQKDTGANREGRGAVAVG